MSVSLAQSQARINYPFHMLNRACSTCFCLRHVFRIPSQIKNALHERNNLQEDRGELPHKASPRLIGVKDCVGGKLPLHAQFMPMSQMAIHADARCSSGSCILHDHLCLSVRLCLAMHSSAVHELFLTVHI